VRLQWIRRPSFDAVTTYTVCHTVMCNGTELSASSVLNADTCVSSQNQSTIHAVAVLSQTTRTCRPDVRHLLGLRKAEMPRRIDPVGVAAFVQRCVKVHNTFCSRAHIHAAPPSGPKPRIQYTSLVPVSRAITRPLSYSSSRPPGRHPCSTNAINPLKLKSSNYYAVAIQA